MTITQLEHAETYRDPLPSKDLFERLKQLLETRDREIRIAKQLRRHLDVFESQHAGVRRSEVLNKMTQSELRRAEIEKEIAEIARLIIAEADNAELI